MDQYTEHKLHSDIKVWVAISEFPMATISYGPTLAQVPSCWKKSTVSASMQIYTENKHALEDTSELSLLVGACSVAICLSLTSWKAHSHLSLPWWRRQPASFMSTGRGDTIFYHFVLHNKYNAVDRGYCTTSAISFTIVSDKLKQIKKFILKVPSHFSARQPWHRY